MSTENSRQLSAISKKIDGATWNIFEGFVLSARVLAPFGPNTCFLRRGILGISGLGELEGAHASRGLFAAFLKRHTGNRLKAGLKCVKLQKVHPKKPCFTR